MLSIKCPKHHSKGLRKVRGMSWTLLLPSASSYIPLTSGCIHHWRWSIGKETSEGATGGFAVGQKILLHGPAPLAAAQLLQQLGCAWRDLQLNAKFIYFSGQTMPIHLPSVTGCLSSFTWALTCFLLPLPKNRRVFCKSWLGAPAAQGSWKTEDKETLLAKGGSSGSHSLWQSGSLALISHILHGCPNHLLLCSSLC